MTNLQRQTASVSALENPFFHRGPVRDPDYFYGRRRETRLLLELVRHAQSVSILGQRRIGKTSFLFNISHPLVFEAHGLSAEQYIFIYIDCEGRGSLSEEDFYRLLLKGLAGKLGREEAWNNLLNGSGPTNVSTFESVIGRVVEMGRRLVFLLDEFEELAINRQVGPDFFSILRRIAVEYGVAYVTVTKDPLLALTYSDHSVLSSPFFNIFQPLRLGLFTPEESIEMIQGLAARAGLSFSPSLVDYILDLAGRHPLLLQLASFHTFDLLQTRGNEPLSAADYQLIRERFWVTAVQHFNYYWSHLDNKARYILATLPLVSASAADLVAGLEEQGLVVRYEQNYCYLSATFRDFVRSQAIPGLLQAGPFVVDRQQQAVIYKDDPLSLTPTQYQLLVYLLERPGQALTFEEIEENVWGDAYTGDSERLKAALKHLRRALGPGATHIANVRGIGYMFEPSPEKS